MQTDLDELGIAKNAREEKLQARKKDHNPKHHEEMERLYRQHVLKDGSKATGWLPLVLIITATYHWGYPQYRQDGLTRPETGNVLISIPTFATANPVGSVVAHVSQHVAAVSHAYESRIFNPPETKS